MRCLAKVLSDLVYESGGVPKYFLPYRPSITGAIIGDGDPSMLLTNKYEIYNMIRTLYTNKNDNHETRSYK